MLQIFLKTLFSYGQDIKRYLVADHGHPLFMLLTKPGLWITFQYRFSRWVKFHFNIPILRQILKLIFAIGQLLVAVFLNCEFPNIAKIGDGLYLPHPYGIVIHCDAKIGSGCCICQQVAIGIGGRGEKMGVPTIGDRVFISPGAKIFGAITIGNDVIIGANAVVNKSLPDNAVAAGVPAKIISHKGSQDYISPRKKELI